jgi:hypothetical protein
MHGTLLCQHLFVLHMLVCGPQVVQQYGCFGAGADVILHNTLANNVGGVAV